MMVETRLWMVPTRPKLGQRLNLSAGYYAFQVSFQSIDVHITA